MKIAKQIVAFEKKAMILKKAGTWSLPTEKTLDDLKKILSDLKKTEETDIKTIKDKMYNTYGNDHFFDVLDDMENKGENNSKGVLAIIIYHLEELTKNYRKNQKSYRYAIPLYELEDLIKKYK